MIAQGSRLLLLGVMTSAFVPHASAQQLEIDLDRSTPEIEATLYSSPTGGLVRGSVVLTGVAAPDTIGPAYGVGVKVTGTPFNPAVSSLGPGDASGGSAIPYLSYMKEIFSTSPTPKLCPRRFRVIDSSCLRSISGSETATSGLKLRPSVSFRAGMVKLGLDSMVSLSPTRRPMAEVPP